MICSLICAVGLTVFVSADQGYEFPKGVTVRQYNQLRQVTEIRHAKVSVTEQEKFIDSLYLAQFKFINPNNYLQLSEVTKSQITPLKNGIRIEKYVLIGDQFFMDRND
ncbi:hypothetical protein ACRWQL_00125 (plasmid) [Shewanella sp. HL-SH4]|uniref:hypothetical protein n=1 Tax=Shewanella sp. HL-SH4 TaxID=3436240 RepID=UPI003EBD984C